jgi:hypothetical protein
MAGPLGMQAEIERITISIYTRFIVRPFLDCALF